MLPLARTNPATPVCARRGELRTATIVFIGELGCRPCLPCRGPERRLEAEGGAVGGFYLSSFDLWHFADGISCAGNGNRKAVHFYYRSEIPPRSPRSGSGRGRRCRAAILRRLRPETGRIRIHCLAIKAKRVFEKEPKVLLTYSASRACPRQANKSMIGLPSPSRVT